MKERRKEANTKLRELINKVRASDPESIKLLLHEFNPLIIRTSAVLHCRYNGVIALDEIIDNAKNLFVYLTIMEYVPGGKARFPQFVKTHLHARLVQLYRPVAKYRYKTVRLLENTMSGNSYNNIYDHQLNDVMTELYSFITTLPQRERDVIENHMCGTTPRDQLAIKYGISKMRMKTIHLRVIKKLKEQLAKKGIGRYCDV